MPFASWLDLAPATVCPEQETCVEVEANSPGREDFHETTLPATVTSRNGSRVPFPSGFHDQPGREMKKPCSEESQGFPFFMQLLSGSTRCVFMSPVDPVVFLLAMIHRWTGIDVDKCRMLFQGQRLQADALIGDYDIV